MSSYLYHFILLRYSFHLWCLSSISILSPGAGSYYGRKKTNLSGCDADFGTGVDVNAAVRFATYGAADRVGDADEERAARLAVPAQQHSD